ncbi:hypothetical protein SynSYN20_00845 [Synechococcus sp. SYN20]|uniref:hypothetical protein n=1 Tax=Synechococcus sp. SYN20 TaxID=1050714 RepID=UPI0016448991|nr:hypothetical protein [Synechococcus sp. SYN20]QNJ25187.1 hypothetical protein SynSYN20_00845 [Synechococcus sp. SYN20]
MNSTQDQPQAVSFLRPDGFVEGYAEQIKAQSQTIFVQRPSADSDGSCLYLIDSNGGRCYLPNTIHLYLTELSIVTVEYENEMYGKQDKLLMSFTTTGGDGFTTRCGMMSYTASSLVLGLSHLNSVALTGELEISFISKGAAVFARVASATHNGYIPAALPKEALGYKLDFDQLQDGLTFINQSITSGDAVPPNYFGQSEVEPEPVATELPELDNLLEDLRSPRKRVAKRPHKNAAAVEATA